MERTGGKPDALGASRHGRIVDRLHIDGKLVKQGIGEGLAAHRIADRDRNDVRGTKHDGESAPCKLALQELRMLLLKLTFLVAAPEMAHAGDGAGNDGRGERSRENKTRRVRTDGIDDHAVGGNISADQSNSLGKGALDDIHIVEEAVSLGNSATGWTVHADGMNF